MTVEAAFQAMLLGDFDEADRLRLTMTEGEWDRAFSLWAATDEAARPVRTARTEAQLWILRHVQAGETLDEALDRLPVETVAQLIALDPDDDKLG